MEIHNKQEQLSEKDIIQVLQFIVKKIANKDILRRLDGGVNLMVRWIPRQPNDIDIRTNQAWYETFKQIFSSTKKEEWYDEKKKKHYIIFAMQWSEVEIAYYDKEARHMDMFEYIIEKSRNNIKVPVLPLEQMREFYQRIWSTEKIEIIENFLNQNPTFKI